MNFISEPDLRRWLRPTRFVFGALCLFLSATFTCYGQEIVFSGKVMGPVSNIYSVFAPASLSQLDAVDSRKEAGGRALKRITENIRWRDIDPDVSRSGLVTFASNRGVNTGIDLSRSEDSFDIFLADGARVHALTNTVADEMLPKFSPSGEQVAFVRERRMLVLLDMATKSERILYRAEEILDFSWSQKGSGIALAVRNRKEGKIVVADCVINCESAGNEFRNLVRFKRLSKRFGGKDGSSCVDCGSVVAVSWSPQGKHLAYVFHPDISGERRLQMISLQGDPEVYTLSGKGQQVQDSPSWSPDGRSLLYSALVDYQFQYDDAEHRKKYRGSLQIFRVNLNGERTRVAVSESAVRAPVFLEADRFAYLKSDSLVARQYALVVGEFDSAAESVVFDRVARNSKLAVRP